MTMRAKFFHWSPSDVLLAGIAVLAVMGGTLSPRAEAQPKPPANAAQPAAPAAPAAAAIPPPVLAAFSYDGTGRRDPFVSLATRGSDPRSEGRLRYQGLTGISVGEVTVKGVVLFEGKLAAMVQAPDDRTYLIRANDRFLDGAVRAVTPEAVVFVQQVNDPLSLIKEREIRKPLRVVEEVK
jgi:hypothetical protein